MQLLFAPIQGYTDAIYRKAHHEIVGGIDAYYTPFVRVEHGAIRRKDQRDINSEACHGVPTVPQVIARNADEFAYLCDSLQQMGWHHIDLNLGCPFPPQVNAGRGSGLLLHPENIESIAKEMHRRHDVQFSVKTRLGVDHTDTLLHLLPLLNSMPLTHITVHPRMARQQYGGTICLDAFDAIYQQCTHPLVLNGDISSYDQCQQLQQRYPRLHGLMIGRGLLAHPAMLTQCSPQQELQQTLAIHSRLLHHVSTTLQGHMQMLMRLRAFWMYQTDMVPRKIYKTLMKTTSMDKYMMAVNAIAKNMN